MANTYTAIDLCNQAFRNLGELPITSLTDTTNPRSLLASQMFAQRREALFSEHFWNFAITRTTLRAYSEPATTLTPGATTGTGITFTAGAAGAFGLDAVTQRIVHEVVGEATITALVATTPAATLTPGAGALTPGQVGVTFTASAAVLVSPDDVGKIIENLGGNGAAIITAVPAATSATATIIEAFDSLATIPASSWRLVATDRVVADITEDFADVNPIASGDWRLYNPAPSWGFTHALNLPTDYVRMQRVEDSATYQREGAYILHDGDSLNVTYVSLVTDITRWPAWVVALFVADLTAAFAEQITGQAAKRQQWLAITEDRLRRARRMDGQEGSPPETTALDLVTARRTGVTGFTNPLRR